MLGLRFWSYIVIAVLISLMYGPDSGYLSGCPHDYAIDNGMDVIKHTQEVTADIFENCSGLIFIVMFAWFCAIFPVLLVFPQEVNVFIKEHDNGYYSCFSYLMSKILSDLPFQLILPNLGSIPVYYLTGQYSQDCWRVIVFAMIFILMSLNASAHGFLLSVIFSDNPLACAFIGLLSVIPMILLSGTYQYPIYCTTKLKNYTEL